MPFYEEVSMRLWKPVLALLLVSAMFVLCSASAPTSGVISDVHSAASNARLRPETLEVQVGVTSPLEARTPPKRVRPARSAGTHVARVRPVPAPVSTVRSQPPAPPAHEEYQGSVPDLIRSIWGSAADCALRIAWRESRFNPRAYNRSGAAGLFQLMPIWYRGRWSFDPFNAYLNTLYAHRMYLDYGFGPWGGCP